MVEGWRCEWLDLHCDRKVFGIIGCLRAGIALGCCIDGVFMGLHSVLALLRRMMKWILNTMYCSWLMSTTLDQ